MPVPIVTIASTVMREEVAVSAPIAVGSGLKPIETGARLEAALPEHNSVRGSQKKEVAVKEW